MGARRLSLVIHPSYDPYMTSWPHDYLAKRLPGQVAQLVVSGFDSSIKISSCEVSTSRDPDAKYAMPRYS